MRQKRLIWQIFPANLLIILITMGGFTWYGAIVLKDFYLHELDTDLVDRAHLVRTTVNEYMGEESYSRLKNFCVISGKESATRITVIDPAGKVLADSDEDAETMENHRDRPEIIEAIHGNIGKSLRFSRTLRTKMFYVAIPLHGSAVKERPAEIIGALRMSVTATAIDTTLQSIRMKIGIGLIVVIFFAVVVALLVSRNISRPLERMKRGAERLSQGDFSQRMSGLQS